jgi:prepilin-type processing-associated H-X9-DG protein
MSRFIRCFVLALALGAAIPQPHAEQVDLFGESMPYDAFEAMPKTPIEVGGGKLNVAFADGKFALPKEKILAWLKRSGTAVAVYYGRFPAAEARVLIVPIPGRGVRRGTAFGYRGPALRLAVGTDSTEDDLAADWKAVHEMIHLALPDVTQDHVWLAEGLAVYVESIARVQAGHLRPEKIWHEFVRDMPQGMPQAGDGGLEGTRSWGRT